MSYEVLRPSPYTDEHGYHWKNSCQVFSFATLAGAKEYASEEGDKIIENYWAHKCPITIDTPKDHPLSPKSKKVRRKKS